MNLVGLKKAICYGNTTVFVNITNFLLILPKAVQFRKKNHFVGKTKLFGTDTTFLVNDRSKSRIVAITTVFVCCILTKLFC